MKTSLGIYHNKKVLITGHTGFKGSWLTLWLNRLGASVYGYSLAPPTQPSLFELLNLKSLMERHEIADIRNTSCIQKAVRDIKPDIIFHLAAQSKVIDSYYSPKDTVEVNTIGSLNVMEAIRLSGLATALVMVTTDKCYENKEWLYGYRETDSLGGYDPYSASKGAAELLIASWRNSFFNPTQISQHGVRIASARAGNVIGGGDWTAHALVPACVYHLQHHLPIPIRNPMATRPWQHVLEPLSGYLTLGAELLAAEAQDMAGYCEAFNFGPPVTSNKSVQQVVEKIISIWGEGEWERVASDESHHEATLLNLSIDKAYHKLEWQPQWDFEKALVETMEWYETFLREPNSLRTFTLSQIKKYTDDPSERLLSSSVVEKYSV